MNKIINSLSSAFVLMLFFLLPITVGAEENINAKLNSNSYKAGDTLKVTVSLKESQNTAAFLLEVYYGLGKIKLQKDREFIVLLYEKQ